MLQPSTETLSILIKVFSIRIWLSWLLLGQQGNWQGIQKSYSQGQHWLHCFPSLCDLLASGKVSKVSCIWETYSSMCGTGGHNTGALVESLVTVAKEVDHYEQWLLSYRGPELCRYHPPPPLLVLATYPAPMSSSMVCTLMGLALPPLAAHPDLPL